MLLRRCSARWVAAALLLATTMGCESMQRLNRWDGPTDHGQFSVQDPVVGKIQKTDSRDAPRTAYATDNWRPPTELPRL